MKNCARLHLLAVLVLTWTGLTACAPSARQRPIPTTPIATSGETLQAVRQRLAGRWALVSLEYAAADGRRAVVDGTAGVLNADAFGNFDIEYRVSDDGLRVLRDLGYSAPAAVISTTGRVVINVDERTVTYLDSNANPFDPQAAAGRANPFALERVRYYEFADDGTLTLSTRHDNGRDAVVSRWRRP